MPKNVQTTTQLHSFHMPAKWWSKSFKLGFNSMWTKNFQNAQAGSQRGRETRDQIANIRWFIKQGSYRKTPTSASLTTLKSLTVWVTTNCGRFLKRWEYRRNLRDWYAGQEATVRTLRGTTDWFKIGKGVHKGCLCCHPIYLTHMQSTSCEDHIYITVLHMIIM